jgi:hypothetical protein
LLRGFLRSGQLIVEANGQDVFARAVHAGFPQPRAAQTVPLEIDAVAAGGRDDVVAAVFCAH